jgi:RNA polymerase sigma-B factor
VSSIHGEDAHDREEDDAEILSLFVLLPDDPQAREQLVVRFQPLAKYLARRFAGRGEESEDLIQVAQIGLLKAIDRFDPERGVRFSTYAAATIVGELKRHFRDKAWAVRVPRRLQELVLAYQRALPVLGQRLGRSPTALEAAEYLGVAREDVVDAIDASQAYSAEPLDAPAAASGHPPTGELGAADPSMAIVELWADLAPAIKELSQRDRSVLYLRFVRDLTQSEIAQEIGVSQMHVSRILTQTIERLRKAAE